MLPMGLKNDKLIPIVGIGVSVAAAVAYILWGPDGNSKSGSRKRRRKVAGLSNLGNTCYLNTILQSLSACPVFVNWLYRALRRGCFKDGRNELAYKLSKTLEVVNDLSSSHQVYSPHEVLYALYNCQWRASQDQQDAHELFQFLLSELSEDKEPIPMAMPLCEASKLMENGRNGLIHRNADLISSIQANLPKVSNKGLDPPFRGLLANHLSCTVCGHRNPVTYTSFDCLSVPIPASVFGTISLEYLLEKFTQMELVHDVECAECSKRLSAEISSPNGTIVHSDSTYSTETIGSTSPKCHRIFRKQMTIGKLPQCLCIHIQRVGWRNDGLPIRREEHVMFTELLDMSPYRQSSAVCNNATNMCSNQMSLRIMPNETMQMQRPNGHCFIGDKFLPSRQSLPLVGGAWAQLSPRQTLESRQTNPTSSTEDDQDNTENRQEASNRLTDCRYKLASAVVHLGNAYSGHFLTYRRAPSTSLDQLCENWMCVSDENVYTAVLPEVLSQKAYMLYYQRV
ncbi:ubiquitin carboxyl-terminal hydrolase 30-like [Amphiura filiformis]|uniref:ubiquitin carboxyl-terminal hydrolase 30-like n=1 Tax=Amphiura filiformis TaxID=82378 RepID=UPI003B21A952